MLSISSQTPIFNELTKSYFPIEQHREEVLSWSRKMTEKGSELFPEELVKEHLELCTTFSMVQRLELDMKKNLKLEKLGSKTRVWNRTIK